MIGSADLAVCPEPRQGVSAQVALVLLISLARLLVDRRRTLQQVAGRIGT